MHVPVFLHGSVTGLLGMAAVAAWHDYGWLMGLYFTVGCAFMVVNGVTCIAKGEWA